jgi:hypothetical protein
LRFIDSSRASGFQDERHAIVLFATGDLPIGGAAEFVSGAAFASAARSLDVLQNAGEWAARREALDSQALHQWTACHVVRYVGRDFAAQQGM